MIRVMFVCHGNICRSTMAEFLFRDRVEKMGLGDKFYIASSATSREEIGNGVHYGTARVLDRFGIDYSKKKAVQLTKADAERYDYFIGMDDANVRNMTKILASGDKVFKFLEFSGSTASIADPWYTGNFEETLRDVEKGIDGFLKHLKEEGKI
ncbi:MAG: low molecular weight phosphotyrosine protein phosphatase [Clostridia bacterium]|nr:low molecular weight phosphotyrosine protein phosphatase [Clostridia bacterium]